MLMRQQFVNGANEIGSGLWIATANRFIGFHRKAQTAIFLTIFIECLALLPLEVQAKLSNGSLMGTLGVRDQRTVALWMSQSIPNLSEGSREFSASFLSSAPTGQPKDKQQSQSADKSAYH